MAFYKSIDKLIPRLSKYGRVCILKKTTAVVNGKLIRAVDKQTERYKCFYRIWTIANSGDRQK